MSRMSRRKKSNKMKKEVLKSCLVAVLIGVVGTAGSFAYFKDNAPISSNLAVSTGTLKVEFNNKDGKPTNSIINISNLKPGNPSSGSRFTITNTGSLSQKATLSFKNTTIGIPDIILKPLLKYINYTITFDNDKNNIQKGNMYELLVENKEITLSANKKPIIIKSGKSVNCEFKATLKTILPGGVTLDEKYANKKITFSTTVTGVQANDPSIK